MKEAVKKLIVVGGVAGGASAATKARRVSESLIIHMYESGPYVSFANCGLPMFVSGQIAERKSLLLQDALSFKSRYNIDVFTEHSVVSIERSKKRVLILNHRNNEQFYDTYDTLVLATGAQAMMPWVEAKQYTNVFSVKTVGEAEGLRAHVEGMTRGQRGVVVGGGFIGLEVCEALMRVGIDVTLIEMMPHVLPPLDAEMAHEIHMAMVSKGVNVMCDTRVKSIVKDVNGNNRATGVEVGNDGHVIPCDVVVVALGVKPNATLARECGLQVGPLGGIVVDDHQLTSDPNIYAAGDVCETMSELTHESVLAALAGPANKQGRVAGANAAGSQPPLKYGGSLGTAIVGFFEHTAAVVGLSEERATRKGIQYHALCMTHADHAGYYPGAHDMDLKLLVEDKTDRILGAQIVGTTGVDKRIDVIATAMHAKMPASELGDLDLSYAPQFSSARDPVVMLGLGASDIARGDVDVITAKALMDQINASTGAPVPRVLDCRTVKEYSDGHLEGAIHIPLNDLRNTIDSLVSSDDPLYVYCRSGFRAYLACRILKQHNINAINVTGGWMQMRLLKNIKIAK